jgi:hypothetical protein
MKDNVTLALIASPGHSGQTWLSLLIGSHTQALSLGEIDVIDGCTSLENACMLCGAGCEFWGAFNRVWSSDDNIFLQLAAFSGKQVLSISRIDKYRKFILPDRMRLKVIRLLRDGRAVTASYLRKYPNRGYEEIVKQWVASAQQNDTWVAEFPPENRMVMKYEDLQEDTPGWMHKLCDFLEINFEKPMLEYWKFKHHIVDGNRGTLSFVRRHFKIGSAPVDKPFYETQKPDTFRDERWRSELDPYQRYLFDKIGGALNRDYGYESDTNTFDLFQSARYCIVRTGQRLKRIVS